MDFVNTIMSSFGTSHHTPSSRLLGSVEDGMLVLLDETVTVYISSTLTLLLLFSLRIIFYPSSIGLCLLTIISHLLQIYSITIPDS